MHIAHLLSLHRPSDIAKALPNLPRGLEKTYDEIFERIMSQEEGLRDIALRTFHWMLAQDGTSDLEYLLAAVCQDPDGDEVLPVDLDPDVILKACQNLVVEEGRYDSTCNLNDVQDRDDLGSVPPCGPNRNSSDFFTYAFHRVPLPLRPRLYRSVSRRFPSPEPSPRFPPSPPTNLSSGPPTPATNWSCRGFPPPPPPGISWPEGPLWSGPPSPPLPGISWLRGSLGPGPPPGPGPSPDSPTTIDLDSNARKRFIRNYRMSRRITAIPPGIRSSSSPRSRTSPPRAGTTTPHTPLTISDPRSGTTTPVTPLGIHSSSTSPLTPSSPVLHPPSPVLRSLHIPPPPSTPSWARPLPPSLFAGPSWTRRRQLRFSHLSVQEYCERLRWTPEVSHCFAAKICLLFLSHLEIQEQPVPDRSWTFQRDPLSWQNDDLRILPTLELALTNSLFRSVRNFADSFWIYNVQRSCSQMGDCQDKKLITALANFLGFPGKTSFSFEQWLRRFTARSHIIWSENTLLPAFWSINDRCRTAKLNWIHPMKLQFHNESRLVTCFFGLDRILLPSGLDVLQPGVQHGRRNSYLGMHVRCFSRICHRSHYYPRC